MNALRPVLLTLALLATQFVTATAPARAANPFCGGSVWIFPWNVGADAPLVSSTSADYALAIFADGKNNAAARVTLITDSDAWSVSVPREALTRTATGDMISPPYLVRFDKAVQVRYAFVDAVGVDDAALVDCPSVVNEVRPYGAGEAPQLGHPVELKPAFLQKIPPLTCGSVYQPPGDTESGFVIGNYGSRARDTTVRIYVDSDGHAAKVEMVTPSGVDGLDANAMGLAQQGKYRPAMFLCTPVVSVILMTYHYKG